MSRSHRLQQVHDGRRRRQPGKPLRDDNCDNGRRDLGRGADVRILLGLGAERGTAQATATRPIPTARSA